MLKEDIKLNGVMVDKEKLCRVSLAIIAMDDTIRTVLKEGKVDEELKLWKIHHDHINQVWKNGDKSRHRNAPVHPTLLNWAVAFLVFCSKAFKLKGELVHF